MSWWDYGYQIAGMANRTTLVDNNTWNNSHIALVGKAMSSNESRAYEIMTELNVDYVLVIFGGVMGYSGMKTIRGTIKGSLNTINNPFEPRGM